VREQAHLPHHQGFIERRERVLATTLITNNSIKVTMTCSHQNHA
jgi:hypothetical protein